MTTSAKPAPYHPAPWQANGDGGLLIDTKITDAKGANVLVAVESIVPGLPYLHFVDKGVRAAVLAAPEMEALLRERSAESCSALGPPKPCPPGVPGSIHDLPTFVDYCGKCWRCRSKDLLARIDAARST